MTIAMNSISDTKSLRTYCEHLRNFEYITVDTEFIREKTFWPRLCLIQVGCEDQAECIDPLSEDLDLSPLFEVFSDTSVVKVFHAARQDLEIFFIRTGVFPTPLFDTQVAAMVCGFGDSVGYETLVATLTGKKVDKTQRFTDWARRPLSKKQIDYAISDVTHLRSIYAALRDELNRNERADWLEEEMSKLVNPDIYRTDPHTAWQRIKSRTKTPRFLAILRELAAWRERTAQSIDIPRRHLAKDECLLELAATIPLSVDDLRHTRLGKGLARSHHGEEIITAIKRGQDLPASDCPMIPKLKHKPQGIGATVDLLKVLLKARSNEYKVAQKLIATVDDLEKIASDDNAEVLALNGWRRDLFGHDALRVKWGQLGLTLSENGQKVEIIEL